MAEKDINDHKDQHGAEAATAPFPSRRAGQQTAEHVVHFSWFKGSGCGSEHITRAVKARNELHVGCAAKIVALAQMDHATFAFRLPLQRVHEDRVADQVIQLVHGNG